MIHKRINTSLANRDDLIAYIKQGNTLEYIFFWGSKSYSIGSNCLSQFYPAYFTIDDIIYRSSEQYYMAEKARFFNDQENLLKIMESKSPFKAKKFGRKVENFNVDEWAKHRFNIVVKGNIAKFDQNQKLRDYLQSTRGKILVEASPHDCIWGIGLSQDDPDALEPRKWRGENLLGFALMKAREALCC